MKHFIESVRRYPCLWKQDSEHYKNIELKEAAWRSVIVECDVVDVKEAKSMWKKLRDGHRQALNKKKTTTKHATSSDSRLWKYEKQMEFLLPYLTNRQKSTSVIDIHDIPLIHMDEAYENTHEEENPNSNQADTESQQTSCNILPNKRKIYKVIEYLEQEQKRRDIRAKQRDSLLQELLIRQANMKPKEDTALKKFFDSMCDVTHDLPEYLQIKIQRQVFNIIMDAREAHLQEQCEIPVFHAPTPSPSH